MIYSGGQRQQSSRLDPAYMTRRVTTQEQLRIIEGERMKKLASSIHLLLPPAVRLGN